MSSHRESSEKKERLKSLSVEDVNNIPPSNGLGKQFGSFSRKTVIFCPKERSEKKIFFLDAESHGILEGDHLDHGFHNIS